MSLVLKIFKVMCVLELFYLCPQLIAVVAILSLIGLVIQMMANKGNELAIKTMNLLAKAHLARQTEKGWVAITALPLAKSILLWILADGILTGKAKKGWEDLKEEAREAASSTVETVKKATSEDDEESDQED